MAVAPGPAYALADAELLAACQEEAFGSGGPGGQHRNRNATAVRLTHRATGLQAQVQDHRDRNRNRSEALGRLRLRLALAIRGESDRRWLDLRRRGSRIPVGANASGYHLVVAVLLDALVTHDWQPGAAAGDLDTSASQLVKVLAADKEVWQAVQRGRATAGLPELRSRS